MKRLLIASVCAAGLSLAACGDRTPDAPADPAMDSAVDATATTEAGDGSAMSADSAGSGGSSSRSGGSSSSAGSSNAGDDGMAASSGSMASGSSSGSMAPSSGTMTTTTVAPENEQVPGGVVAPGTPPPLPKGSYSSQGPRSN